MTIDFSYITNKPALLKADWIFHMVVGGDVSNL